MAPPSKILILIAAMLSALFMTIEARIIDDGDAATSPAKNKLLVNVCAKSENPTSCLNTLIGNPKASYTTNIRPVAGIALAAVCEVSRTAQGVLRQALKSNPRAGKALRSCITYFDDTIKELILRGGDLKQGMETLDVHYALDSVARCETAMANDKVSVATVKNVIHQWKDMFNVAYFAVTEVENASSVV